MALNANKYITPNGVPVGLKQKMKSGSWGEDGDTELKNDNYGIAIDAGSEGDVLTLEGTTVKLKAIPQVGATPYTFKTTTSEPPGDGNMVFNNVVYSSVTKVFMSDLNANGTDIGAFLTSSLEIGGTLLIQQKADQGQFVRFTITGVTDDGAYHDVDVTFIDQGGSNFGNNNNLLLTVVSAGASSSANTEINAVSGNLAIPIKAINSQFYEIDASAGGVTITLPLASASIGKSLFFKKVDSSPNAMTLSSADLIDGQTTNTSNSQFDGLLAICNGTTWRVVADYARTVAFSADRSGQVQQSIPTGTPTVVENNQEQIDVGDFYNPSTFKWIPAPGIYTVKGHTRIFNLDTNDEVIVRITKNGTPIYFSNEFSTMNNQDPSTGAEGLTLANGTDEYQMTVEHNQGTNLNISSDPNETYFYGVRIK